MSSRDLALREGRSSQGLFLVGQAFRRALASQLHPRMIAALFLPFVIAFLGAVVLLWFFWDPLTAWMDQQASSWGVFNTVDGWFVAVGLFSLKLWLVPLMAAGMLLPMAGILGLGIAAVFVMPIVLAHLEKRDYLGLSRQGRHAAALGTWNAVWVGVLFCLGWFFTMPLWLIPPFALVLPVFWWAFALNRMLRVDAMIEHASPTERRLLWRRHRRQLWLLAACLALLNLVPLFWLVMPVYSALVYAHFCLEAVRRLRTETVIDM
jgi:hypothetical protein